MKTGMAMNYTEMFLYFASNENKETVLFLHEKINLKD